MDSKEKEVRFDIYCKHCAHSALLGREDPCDECLGNPSNEDSHVPINFKKAKPFINYLLPDPYVMSYTRDRTKSTRWAEQEPTEKDLKSFFEKFPDGDFYEKP